MMRSLFCFLFLLYVALLGIGIYVSISLISKIANAENLTTDNLAAPMGSMTTSGGTSYGTGSGCQQGKYCTSGTRGGGGTYTSNFNVPLTEKEVNKGFTLNSGITINSHVSNSYLDSCTNVMQSGDCRDIYKLTITLSDDGTVVETFVHEEELTWSGIKDFTYTDTVSENDYGVLTGVFSLYGIDAGYPYGFYGPQFSDPSLTIDYQTVLIQHQDTEVITQNETVVQDQIIQIAEVSIPVTTVDTATTTTPTTTSFSSAPAANAAPAANIDPPSEPEAPEAPTVQTETAPAEPEATAEVEAEIEAEVEANTETPANDTQVAEKPSGTPKATKTRTRRMTPAQAAQTVVSRIAPSQRYGTNAQTVTMVAMGMMSNTGGLLKSSGIPDATKFFKSTNIPDGPSLVNPLQNYMLFGTSNGAHDALVESQWRN